MVSNHEFLERLVLLCASPSFVTQVCVLAWMIRERRTLLLANESDCSLELIFALTIASIVGGFAFILSLLAPETGSALCVAQGVLITWYSIMSFLIMSFMSYVMNRFLHVHETISRRILNLFYASSIVFALICSIVPVHVGFENTGGWCWIQFEGLGALYRWIFYYGEFAIASIYVLCMTIKTNLDIQKKWGKDAVTTVLSHMPPTVRNLRWYTVAFVVWFLPNIVRRTVDTFTGGYSPYPLIVLQAIGITSMGFWNSLIFVLVGITYRYGKDAVANDASTMSTIHSFSPHLSSQSSFTLSTKDSKTKLTPVSQPKMAEIPEDKPTPLDLNTINTTRKVKQENEPTKLDEPTINIVYTDEVDMGRASITNLDGHGTQIEDRVIRLREPTVVSALAPSIDMLTVPRSVRPSMESTRNTEKSQWG